MLRAIPLLLLVQSINASAGPLDRCVRLIERLRDAGDCQTTEAVSSLTWADGFTKSQSSGRHNWPRAVMSGPCPKYSTTLKEWRPGRVRPGRQIVNVKAITKRVSADGRYSGDYSVSKIEYACERRGSVWRIYSEEVTHRIDSINPAAVTLFEKGGGWDRR